MEKKKSAYNLLENKIGYYIYDLRIGKHFLEAKKALVIKEKPNKLDHIKM